MAQNTASRLSGSMSSSTAMTILDMEGRKATAPMSARHTSAGLGLRIWITVSFWVAVRGSWSITRTTLLTPMPSRRCSR